MWYTERMPATSPDRHTLTVRCRRGATHTVAIDTGLRLYSSGHDLESEDVILALGGNINHPCREALRHFGAACDVARAAAAIDDTPETTWDVPRAAWMDTATPGCRGCHGRESTPTHLSSITHLAAARRLDPNILTPAVEWLQHHAPTLQPAAVTNTGGVPITGPYRAAATHILTHCNPGEPGSIERGVAHLRRGGVRTGWLRDVAGNLPDRVPGLGSVPQLVRAIASARTIPPHLVAAYLAAGIRSHIYTYAKAGVSPADVAAVWEASGRRQPLALHIHAGHDPAPIIARARRR